MLVACVDALSRVSGELVVANVDHLTNESTLSKSTDALELCAPVQVPSLGRTMQQQPAMTSIIRPLTLACWSPDDSGKWPDCFAHLTEGHFGTLPSPFTVPNYLWLVASDVALEQDEARQVFLL